MDAKAFDDLYFQFARSAPVLCMIVAASCVTVWIIVQGRKAQQDALIRSRRSVELSEHAVRLAERSLAFQEEANRLLRELVGKAR